jgi:hypothetical protein
MLFALAVAAAVPAPAALAATAPKETACIDTHRQSNWKAVDEKTLYISESKQTVYAVEFANGCPRMDSPFVKFTQLNRSGMGWICAPIDLDITVHDTPGMSVKCLATSIRKLSPAEIKALPKEVQP